MAADERFKRWSITESDLADLTPSKARDLIIRCFYEAQRETFARAKQDLGVPAKDENLMASIVSSIKMTFRGVGEDFENPTKESLSKVVEALSKKAASWGTPQDIIAYHTAQIRKIISLLVD